MKRARARGRLFHTGEKLYKTMVLTIKKDLSRNIRDVHTREEMGGESSIFMLKVKVKSVHNAFFFNCIKKESSYSKKGCIHP